MSNLNEGTIEYQIVHGDDILMRFSDKEKATEQFAKTAKEFETEYERSYSISKSGTEFIPFSTAVKLYEVKLGRFMDEISSKVIM